jgi:hypothetical protein
LKLVREIEARMADADAMSPYWLDTADSDLDALFDALGDYAGPYFFFGSNPGDGADYGYWLSEGWDEDFVSVTARSTYGFGGARFNADRPTSIKVSDLSEVPKWFHGELAVVNDHGNVALYVKTSRTLREIWSVV